MIHLRMPLAFSAALVVAGCTPADPTIDPASSGGGNGNGSGQAGFASPSSAPSPTILNSGTCPYSPAAALMGGAICVCKDLALAGRLETRALAGESADVGVNGRFAAATETLVQGSLIAQDALAVSGNMQIAGNVETAGAVTGAGQLAMTKDFVVGHDVTLAGSLDVGGAMRLGGHAMIVGDGKHPAPSPLTGTVAEPCGCDGPQVYDIAGRVAAAKAQNDNAKAGLPTELRLIGEGDHELATGNYYFTNVTTVGLRRIKIAGAVAIHIDGDLTTVGESDITLEAGGSLDLFINGNLQNAGDLRLGEGASAGAFRLYVGGDRSVSAGGQTFHGLLYAPHALVAFAGGTTVYGSVFARELVYAGSLLVEGRSPTQPSSNVCTPAPSGNGSGGSGGSGGTGGQSSDGVPPIK